MMFHNLLMYLKKTCTLPRMDTILTPIVSALEHLHDIGFTWNCNGNIVSTKVFLCLLSCDSVARATLQNLKKFNGKFGCGFCLHPGEVVKKGHG